MLVAIVLGSEELLLPEMSSIRLRNRNRNDQGVQPHYYGSPNPHHNPDLWVRPQGHHYPNPFEVVYGDPSPGKADTIYKTPSYLRIEREIAKSTGCNPHETSPNYQYGSPNLVDDSPEGFESPDTIIDERPKRGNLIISRESSFRHRNTIRQRNKMVRRHDLEQDSESVFSTEKKHRRSGLSFVFPIKRKTSLKYRSSCRQRFKSQKEIDEYFFMNNITALMKDVLPRTMMTYEYKSIVKVTPELQAHPAHFAISRAAKFTMVLNRIQAKQSSLQGQRLKETEPLLPSSEQDYRDLMRTPSPTESDQNRRDLIISTVTQEYRIKVFAGRYLVPPKIERVLPFESDILSPETKVAIETKIALEVLLRRTLAAKIDYRLRCGTGDRKRELPKQGSVKLSNASSLSGLTDPSQMSTLSDPFLTNKPLNLTSFIQQHSEVFPLSQVSLPLGSPVLDPKRQNFKTPNKEEMEQSGNDQITPHTHFPSSSISGSDKSNFRISLSNMFINDFNKTFFENERRREGDKNLSNINLFSLQPRNRSNVTISSGESIIESQSADQTSPSKSKYSPLQSSGYRSGLSHGTKLTDCSSYSSLRKRISSIPESSLIQCLEKVARAVNDYLRQEHGMAYMKNPGMYMHRELSRSKYSLSYLNQELTCGSQMSKESLHRYHSCLLSSILMLERVNIPGDPSADILPPGKWMTLYLQNEEIQRKQSKESFGSVATTECRL